MRTILNELQTQLDGMEKIRPTSSLIQFKKCILQAKINVIKADIDKLRNSRIVILAESYINTGRYTSINSKGQCREMQPRLTNDPYYHICNIISDITYSADWSTY